VLEVIRSMRGRDGGEGMFDVFDASGTRTAVIEFIPDGEESVVAKTPWGSLRVYQVMEGGIGKIAVSLDGRPLAFVTFAKMFMRWNVKMASGPDIPFKMTLFTDVLRHESDIGEFRFRFKTPTMLARPECSVSIKGSGMVNSEDLALVFLALYGFQCFVAIHAKEIIRKNR
jgi:hypothetical protein